MSQVSETRNTADAREHAQTPGERITHAVPMKTRRYSINVAVVTGSNHSPNFGHTTRHGLHGSRRRFVAEFLTYQILRLKPWLGSNWPSDPASNILRHGRCSSGSEVQQEWIRQDGAILEDNVYVQESKRWCFMPCNTDMQRCAYWTRPEQRMHTAPGRPRRTDCFMTQE